MKGIAREYNFLNKEMDKKYKSEDEEAASKPTGAAVVWGVFSILIIVVGSLVIYAIFCLFCGPKV